MIQERSIYQELAAELTGQSIDAGELLFALERRQGKARARMRRAAPDGRFRGRAGTQEHRSFLMDLAESCAYAAAMMDVVLLAEQAKKAGAA